MKERVIERIKKIDIELVVINGLNIFGIYENNILLRLNVRVFG